MIIKIGDYATHGITIDPHDKRPDKELVACDLHPGQSFRNPGDANPRPMPEHLVLPPNDCIRIETEEFLRIPRGAFGQVCSRASLTADGLLVANLKIDPLFFGRLVVTVYNASPRQLTIEKEQAFCSIFFQTVEGDGVPPTSAPRQPPDPKILTGSRFVEVVRRVWPFALTFVASVVASLFAAYLFSWVAAPKDHPIPNSTAAHQSR